MSGARRRSGGILSVVLLSSAAAAATAAGTGALSPLVAQTIKGKLLAQGTDTPIPLGRVMMFTEAGDSVATTFTDDSGEFSLSSPMPGGFLLAAAALGHAESWAGVFELGADAEMTVEFRLSPQPITLEGLIVSGQKVQAPALVRNGFYERLQRGFGHFITPADLEDSFAVQTQDLFYRMGRIRVVYGGIGGDRVVMRGPGGNCSPRIYLDGMRVSLNGMPMNALVPINTLTAVEVYRGPAETPIEYLGVGQDLCGAIVFWTKSQ